jgi:hypothetical protein
VSLDLERLYRILKVYLGLIKWFAISFLVIYSMLRFKAAYVGNVLDIGDEEVIVSAKKTAIITLGFHLAKSPCLS